MNSGNKILLAIILAVVAGAIYHQLFNKSKTPSASNGLTTTFVLTDIHGNSFDMSKERGRVVFVNFFATWCPPCQAEFPEVVKLARDYDGQKVTVISIAIDSPETVDKVKPFAESQGAVHQVLLGEGTDKVSSAYGVSPIPASFVVNKEGRIVEYFEGFRGEQDVDHWKEAINSALQ